MPKLGRRSVFIKDCVEKMHLNWKSGILIIYWLSAKYSGKTPPLLNKSKFHVDKIVILYVFYHSSSF